MELAKYKFLKEKGKLTLRKMADAFEVEIKRYDPDTGEEISPIREYFRLEELYDLKRRIETDLENLQELIQDCEKIIQENK